MHCVLYLPYVILADSPLEASNGTFLFQTILYMFTDFIRLFLCCVEVSKNIFKILIFWDFSWEGGGTSPKIVITLPFPGPMRRYPVKEYPIGSAVSEILRYTKTNRHPVTLV